MQITCCTMCAVEHEKLKIFLKFRQTFELKKRKVEVFFFLYRKLRAEISVSINEFGLFVINFVENEYLAPKFEYLKCRDIHLSIQEYFSSLTKLMKRLISAKFVTKSDESVARNLKMLISEWISESLSQLRALEISWKKIKIVNRFFKLSQRVCFH